MFAAALALLTFAAAPVPKDLPKPPATPEGEWKLVDGTNDGNPGDMEYLGAAVTIKEGKLAIASARRTEAATFTFDPKAAPATMDIVPEGNGRGRVVKAIYKVENDKLTICFTREGERPTKFESLAGSNTTLLVLTREKKK